MRVYALLLGIAVTTGYGYTAQMAVASLGAGRSIVTAPAATTDPRPSLDGVWYGGVLDPVTVEASSGTRAAALGSRVLSRPTVRCVETRSSKFRAVS